MKDKLLQYNGVTWEKKKVNSIDEQINSSTNEGIIIVIISII